MDGKPKYGINEQMKGAEYLIEDTRKSLDDLREQIARLGQTVGIPNTHEDHMKYNVQRVKEDMQTPESQMNCMRSEGRK